MSQESDGLTDRAMEHTERAMVAFAALQRATSAIRFIEESDLSISKFQDLFPDIWDDLNKATQYLSTVDPSIPSPIFLYN
jgi:hypothetical protein